MAARSSIVISREAEERVLVIKRVFNAPPEVLFKLWTDPEHGTRWMGPSDYPVVHMEADVRPGGRWRKCLRPVKGGPDRWQSGVYHEIVEPERLVFTYAWEDETGKRGHETLVTVTFEEEDGKTHLTFKQELFPSADQRDGHAGGWSSSLDRLRDYLSAL